MVDRVIYTLWTDNGNSFDKILVSRDFFRKMAELSVWSAHNNFNNVELYADKHGVDYITRETNCKFTKINVIDFDQLEFDPSWWNYPKMHTYTLQEKPFIHVDFDVVMKERFSNQLHGADIYTEMIRSYAYSSFFHNNNVGKLPMPSGLICSGLLGGESNAIFIENMKFASKVVNRCDAQFYDVVGIEEYNLSALAEIKNMTVKPLDHDTFAHFQGQNKIEKYGHTINELHKTIFES
jgi:hypothetical protein